VTGWSSGVGAAGSPARQVDENDWQTSLAKSARELGSAADDLAGGVNGRNTNNTLLQVNHNQGSVGI